ncbi:MAG: SRPBCC family protein [Acidimicrobiales bacterium]
MQGSVTVEIAAPPDRVWSLVSDVTAIGRFSPETFEAEWLDGATGPAEGARFRGHVRRNGRGPTYWTTCEVTECEPGRRFGFGVVTPAGKVLNRWRYELEPTDEGTSLTESFALSPTPLLRLYWLLAGWARGRANVRGMATTLGRVKAAAESDAGGSTPA